MGNYQLTVNKKQAEVLLRALDLFSRIGLANFEEILRHPQWNNKRWTGANIDPYCDKYYRCSELLKMAKTLLTGLHKNASYGIAAPEVDEDSKIAYDTYQVIENHLAWDKNPKGGTTVDFRDPLRFSEESLPEITGTILCSSS